MSATATSLSRSLGLVRATAMVVGTIIGASVFVQPSEVTGQVPSISGALLVWAVAGVLTILGALVTAELGSAFPEAGGTYAFLREEYSPAIGFLWGWAMFWVMHSGIIAALAMVLARYVEFFVPLGDVGIRVVAVSTILTLSVVNYRGVAHGSALQTAFTIVKVGVVLAMIVVAFVVGSASSSASAASAASAAPPASPASFGLALVAGLFAFGGWHMVTYTAEETVEPERTIPRALVIGTLVVTACYVLLNAAYFYVLPITMVASSTRVAADAADAVLGTGGAAFMSGLVVFSTFGALAGIVLTGPRVYYAMARDGLLFRWAGAVHERYRTPHRAIVLQGVWASVLVATGTYRDLFTRVIYTEWIFFALMALGVLLLRRRPNYEPSYRVWGYPVVPVVFALSAVAIVGNQIASDPADSAVGLGIVILGLPVYYLWLRRTRTPDGDLA
jgi:APA family basic amino acid/polyamine antiporter